MSFNNGTSYDNFRSMLPEMVGTGFCFSDDRAHFGPGVYGTKMGFGSDPYQVTVNNWGPNAAQSKVDEGSVDVCINFSGLSVSSHCTPQAPSRRARSMA
jgi:hypothetical protein